MPVVLGDALHCIDTGERIPAGCVAAVRAAAAGCDPESVPMHVAVRGAVPALQVLGLFLRRQRSPHDALVLLQRAYAVAGELAGAWLHSFLESSETGGPDVVVSTSDDVGLEPVESLMLKLVADGRSNAEIAGLTNYSPQAVGWRLSRLMRRWRAPNRAALVRVAFVRGVLATGRARWRGPERPAPPRSITVRDRP